MTLCTTTEPELSPSTQASGASGSREELDELRHVNLDDGPFDVSSIDLSDHEDGVQTQVKVFTDDFIHPQDCLPNGDVKPRRPIPVIRESELLRDLQRVGDHWILPGPLNGWPSLVNLELRSIDQKQSGPLGLFLGMKCLWNCHDRRELPEALPETCEATFLSPSWKKKGWSKRSPGFVWWFSPSALCGGSVGCGVVFGENLVEVLQGAQGQAQKVHYLVHRYPVDRVETLRDVQTWHAAVVIEWSHEKFVTLFELSWLNGIGGYGGKSNWVEDKLSPSPELYQSMAPSMRASWDENHSEVRCFDVPVAGKEELLQFLERYSDTGPLPKTQWRFVAPQIYLSAEVRVRFRSPAHIAGYLLNYISRASEYDTLRANCQTFAADFFAFLTGQKDTQPFSGIVRPAYSRRTHAFLYHPR